MPAQNEGAEAPKNESAPEAPVREPSTNAQLREALARVTRERDEVVKRADDAERMLSEATDPKNVGAVGAKLGVADREIESLKGENAILRRRIGELELSLRATEERASANARPVQMGERRQILLTRLQYDGREYPPGALLPFDALDPPPGCDGLQEGVVWEWSRG